MNLGVNEREELFSMVRQYLNENGMDYLPKSNNQEFIFPVLFGGYFK